MSFPSLVNTYMDEYFLKWAGGYHCVSQAGSCQCAGF